MIVVVDWLIGTVMVLYTEDCNVARTAAGPSKINFICPLLFAVVTNK